MLHDLVCVAVLVDVVRVVVGVVVRPVVVSVGCAGTVAGQLVLELADLGHVDKKIGGGRGIRFVLVDGRRCR